MTAASCILIALFLPYWTIHTALCLNLICNNLNPCSLSITSKNCFWIYQAHTGTGQDRSCQQTHRIFSQISLWNLDMWRITSILLGKRKRMQKTNSCFCTNPPQQAIVLAQNTPTIGRFNHNWWAVSPTIPPPQCLSEGTQPLPSHAHLTLSFSQLQSRNKTFISLLLQLAWIVHNKKKLPQFKLISACQQPQCGENMNLHTANFAGWKKNPKNSNCISKLSIKAALLNQWQIKIWNDLWTLTI